MAVYTDVAADELADFLSQYEIGELLSYKGICCTPRPAPSS